MTTNQPSASVSVSVGELIERIQAATGPDREIDGQIAVALRWLSEPARTQRWAREWGGGFEADETGRVYLTHTNGGRGLNYLSAPFTASLDAVLALVGEKLPALEGELLNDAMEDMARCGWRPDQPYGPQLARYLIAALLLTLQAKGAG